MILYLDTSAMVKLYIEEEHSATVRRWVADATSRVSSSVAYPEALSAFARRHRARELDDDGFSRVVESFEWDWNAFNAVNVQELLAGQLALAHPLRGFDAVHLAAAVTMSQRVSELAFTSFDTDLNQAAEAEGLSVLVP